ncbi:MAG TPA: helix-turn-helix domain-containing protein [Candidatus Enterococcus avicola]|uniref:Helix-turn-helix domain-containing protein n=1 Tax=Candidatus Enterococcus avicola TaxID=2838561 RepID=A0A9D2F6T7_9ENTE|nr:helix-turn-helix domain-containing protein [Candidatus Enterococcus avicola]
MNSQQNFSNNLKKLLAGQGYTVYEFSEKVNVAPSTIYNIMAQKKGASLEMADRLSQVLGTTVSEMLRPQARTNVAHARRLAELNRGGRKLYDTFHEFFADDEIDMEDEEVITTLNWFLATKKD